MARIRETGGGETGDGAGARILAAVRSALIGRADLARRPRYTADEWAALTREEKKACSGIGIAAVRQVPEDVYDQIDELGRLRYEPAVPSLIEVWEHCPGHMAVVKAGHALMAIGTPEARAALRAGTDDHEYIAQVLAVRTMFTDEGDPWDNMSWLFTGARLATASGISAAWRVLACFCDSGRGPEYDLVSTDRRWLGLCILLRDHDSLAPAAREALRLADPAVTRPALDAARRAREEQARRAPALVAGSLLRRYQRGEHRAVWRELAGAGPLNDAWRAEAAQVAAATMERVRDNAERLAAAMIARGWPVPPGTAVPGPDPEAGQYMEQLEQALGMPVPPALSAFWQVVGEIELVPDHSVHKSLPAGVPGVLWQMDPLEIYGCISIGIELDEWRDQQEGAHPEAALLDLGVSRDGALKTGASGSTNAISLPFAGADPVVHDGLGLRFTDYLRRAFENKGFLDNSLTMYGTGEEKSAAAQWLASVEFEPVGF